MPSGAYPSLGSWLSLNITLGCLGHPQAQALTTPYSIVHQIFTQNLKTTQHKTQQKTREIRQYKKKNHHFWYCCELILYLYWCNIYCIPTFPWFIAPDTTHRYIKISKQHKENRICQKQNSLQQSGNLAYFCNSKHSEKLGKQRQLIYQSCVNNS